MWLFCFVINILVLIFSSSFFTLLSFVPLVFLASGLTPIVIIFSFFLLLSTVVLISFYGFSWLVFWLNISIFGFIFGFAWGIFFMLSLVFLSFFISFFFHFLQKWFGFVNAFAWLFNPGFLFEDSSDFELAAD